MWQPKRRWVLLGLMQSVSTAFPAKAQTMPVKSPTPEQVVRGFLDNVRSGRNPEAAAIYMAPQVQAHQVQSEREETLIRTPEDYAAHVREFQRAFGPFTFTVEALIAQGDLVSVRWRQMGHHIQSLNGEAPTGAELIELTSVVYRVADGKIVEYWLQTDRKGMDLQLEKANNRLH